MIVMAVGFLLNPSFLLVKPLGYEFDNRERESRGEDFTLLRIIPETCHGRVHP